jgi:hypothetical protein
MSKESEAEALGEKQVEDNHLLAEKLLRDRAETKMIQEAEAKIEGEKQQKIDDAALNVELKKDLINHQAEKLLLKQFDARDDFMDNIEE